MKNIPIYFALAAVLFGANCSEHTASDKKITKTEAVIQAPPENDNGDEKFEVKLNLEKNKVYTQNCRAKTMIYQTMGVQQVTMSVNLETKISYKVVDIQNNIYEMEVRYEKLSMTTGMQQTEMLYTTGSNEKDVMSRSLDALRSKPFTIKMSSTGKVEEIKGIESLVQSIVGSNKALDETKRKQLSSQLLQAFGESTLKGNMELCSAVFPSKKVSKGEHWLVRTQLGSAMAPNAESDLELKDVNDQYYHIAGNSKIVARSKDAFAEMNGVTMSYNMKGNMSSDIKLDRKSGWISSAKFTQFISGEAFIKSTDKMQPDMTVPMTANTETSLTE
jgi:hypothetical protein